MKKSELRQIIREILKEQRIGKAPVSTMDMTSMGGGADMSQICAAAEALEREWQRNNGPKPWPLWDRFKHAIRHILCSFNISLIICLNSDFFIFSIY